MLAIPNVISPSTKQIWITMKKFLLVSTLIFTTALAYSQDIVDVSQTSDGRLKVWNSQYSEIAHKYLFAGDQLSGFSPEIIVVTSKDNRVTVYDQKFNEIAHKYLFDGDNVKHVCGNYIIIKSNNGLLTIYDSKFNIGSHRYE